MLRSDRNILSVENKQLTGKGTKLFLKGEWQNEI